jgi:hypothetical protein
MLSRKHNGLLVDNSQVLWQAQEGAVGKALYEERRAKGFLPGSKWAGDARSDALRVRGGFNRGFRLSGAEPSGDPSGREVKANASASG